jgi:hypothetical protein
VRVELSPGEQLHASAVGSARRIKAQAASRQEPHGPLAGDPRSVDIEAACAELAVAKALGRYWPASTEPDRREGDVAGGIHVRHTANGRDGRSCLILHDEDADDGIFVLVVGREGRYELAGWTRGSDGKQPEYWRDDERVRPAFFVPASVLLPASRLAASPAPAFYGMEPAA